MLTEPAIATSNRTNVNSSLGANKAEQTVVNHRILQNLSGGDARKIQKQPTIQRVMPGTNAANPLQWNELLEGLSQVIETRLQNKFRKRSFEKVT